MTDTALLRVQGAALHTTLGESALAEHNFDRALAEFRRGDTAYDKSSGDGVRAVLAARARAHVRCGRAVGLGDRAVRDVHRDAVLQSAGGDRSVGVGASAAAAGWVRRARGEAVSVDELSHLRSDSSEPRPRVLSSPSSHTSPRPTDGRRTSL